MSRVFGAVAQNGYVVRDILAAMDHWINVIGVGPWYYIDRVKTDYFRHRGEASGVEMSIAIANSGDLQIELIQQRNDAPSLYKEFLDSGREGLQHLAYWTRDFQALYDRALSLGYKVGHEGQADSSGQVKRRREASPATAGAGPVASQSAQDRGRRPGMPRRL